MLKLSRRMQYIYEQLIPGEPVWDFCCDHGYIGLNVYQSGHFPEVHFVDQVPHIIESLRTRFQDEYFSPHLHQKAYFWPQDASSIQQVQGTLIITGVGAQSILKILHSILSSGGLQASRIVLGPQRDENFFEKELTDWKEFKDLFFKKHIQEIQEGRRLRRIFIFDRIAP